MITRELGAPDEDAAVRLLQTAIHACRFPDALEAMALWRRWLKECTVVGTFDDSGTLITLRAYDRIDPTTARQRALIYAEAAMTTTGVGVDPRVVRGAIAWFRRHGILRIVSPVVRADGTAADLEDWRARAALVGGEVREGVGGGMPAVVYEVDELARRVGA